MNDMSLLDYMSFDVSWFTTLPGILITVGLVLLLGGLIFYILSGKKDKGEVAENADAPKAEGEEAPATAEAAPAETPAAPEVVATPEVTPEVAAPEAQPVTEELRELL